LNKGNLIEAPTKPETVTFLTLVRPMNYMRYLEIEMPERLELLAASRGRNILATYFGLEIKNSANLSFYKEQLPYVYARHNVQSSFIVNYWKDLITLGIGIAAALLFFVIEKVSFSEGWELLELVSKRIRVILMWNYVLMVFAWNIDDLILFAAMEYMTIAKQPESPVTTPVSFLVSLVFLALMLGFVYGTYKLIQKRRYFLKADPQFKKSNYAKQFDTQYEYYQVLYRGFKDNNIFNQFFFLIYMFRIALPMIIAISAIKSPLVVSIFQLFINVDILLYLFIMRPFKKIINQIQLVSYEIIIFMMNIGVLILAAKSPTGKESAESIRIGDMIIVGNDIINFLAIIFLAIKLYLEATALHKDMKRLKNISTKEKVTTYLQLLALPFQQDNMGFEEMINYYCPPPKPWLEPLLKRLFNVMISCIKDLFSSNKNKKLPIKRQNNTDDLNGLHTYDYEHKMLNRGYETSRVEHEETMNPEVRFINKGASIMDLTTTGHERGNHLDKFVDDEPMSIETSPVINPEPYNSAPKNKNGPSAGLPLSRPQSEMSVIGRKAVLDNTGLSLEPFLLPPQMSPEGKITPQLGEQHHHIVKLESPQFEERNHGVDSESASNSKNQNLTSSNILKKRGKANNLDIQLDNSNDNPGSGEKPASGIPDNISPISKYMESNQITPIHQSLKFGKDNVGKGSTKLTSQELNTQSEFYPEPFTLDDSFDKHKKKTAKRKKKAKPDLKLSDLKPEEDEDKDYIGWKPYNGE